MGKLCLLAALFFALSGPIWAQFTGINSTDGANFAQGRAIAATPNDETMTVGSFDGVLDMSGFGGPVLNPAGGGTKGFLFKLNSGASYDWAYSFVGTGGGCIVEDVVHDEQNNLVYVTGTVREELVIFDANNIPQIGTTGAFIGTGENLFIACFNGGGGLVYGYLGVGGLAEGGEGLVVHETTGNVGLTGFFTGNIDYFEFGSAIPSFSWASSSSLQKDVVVASFSSNLASLNFHASLEGAGNDIGYGIGYSSTGHLFVTGQFEDAIRAQSSSGSFSPYFSPSVGGVDDIFVCKFKHPGIFEWLSTAGSPEADGSYDLVTLHEPGPVDGYCVITGKYTADLVLNDFNQSPTLNVPHNCGPGINQMMVVGYDPNGMPIWADWVENCLATPGASYGAIGQSLSLVGTATDVVFVAGQVENYAEVWGTYNGGGSGAGVPGVLDSDIGSIIMRIHVPYLTGDYSSALIYANNSNPLSIDHDPGYGVSVAQNSCAVYVTGAFQSPNAQFAPLPLFPGSCTISPCATQAYWGLLNCSSFKTSGTTAVEEATRPQLSLFPNPTSGHLTLRMEAGQTLPTTLVLTDLQGRKLMEREFADGFTEHVLDCSQLPMGMYSIAVQQPGSSPLFLHFIKQ